MDESRRGSDHVQALLKLWSESLQNFSQAAFAFSPEASPPEGLKQIRSNFLQTLAQAWDEYLRSPQFLQSRRQLLENAVHIRKMSQEYFQNARQSTGAVGQKDLDGIVSTVRQAETRILGQLADLSQQLKAVQDQLHRLDQETRNPSGTNQRPIRKKISRK